MQITIFGCGYVGLVTGACLADAGNQVMCVDIDQAKVDDLNNGQVRIYEPGLKNIVIRNIEAGRLSFTTNAKTAVDAGEYIFICVGTPEGVDGASDLQQVFSVAETIAKHMEDHKIVVLKSTVPVGTTDEVYNRITSVLLTRGRKADFDIVSNPEFLREGSAVPDFTHPDRIIVGCDSGETAARMHDLYKPFIQGSDRIMVMDPRSSEMSKQAANAMLASRISFMNEMANIAELVGADIDEVRRGIGSDPRIGDKFLYSGCGYGGSCFPKDVLALENLARSYGLEAKILQAVDEVNRRQKEILFSKISRVFPALNDVTIALWGLSFKPNTNDVREAPSLVLIKQLLDAGAQVQAYDPVANADVMRYFKGRNGLHFFETAEAALSGADALCVITEWQEFRSPDFPAILRTLKRPIIFDGRNIYDPLFMKRAGFSYYGIGRGVVSYGS